MRIALIGYGKMGQIIERIAKQRGHDIVLVIRSTNTDELNEANLNRADVAIEFTRPEAARDNVICCLDSGTPVVCGTTGWNEGLAQAKLAAVKANTAFLHATNFSIGVNIFFEVNKYLASMMNDQPDYEVMLEETHHTQKKDAPSGTAITLAEQVIDNVRRKRHWTLGPESTAAGIPIVAHRVDSVPGTHSVRYTSNIDDIEIIHTAHSREGFGLGAVLAAEYIMGRKGLFTMKDVLGLSNRL